MTELTWRASRPGLDFIVTDSDSETKVRLLPDDDQETLLRKLARVLEMAGARPPAQSRMGLADIFRPTNPAQDKEVLRIPTVAGPIVTGNMWESQDIDSLPEDTTIA